MMNKTTLGKKISFYIPKWYVKSKMNNIKYFDYKVTPIIKNLFSAHSLYRYHNKLRKNPDKVINQRKYVTVMGDFNAFIANKIIDDGIIFKLPRSAGKIFVQKYKIEVNVEKNIKPSTIDWGTTNKYNKNRKPGESKKLFYYFNEGTDGFSFRIKHHRSKGIKLLRFFPSLKMKRRLVERIKSGKPLNYINKM